MKKKVNQNEFRKYIDVDNEHSFKFLYTQIAIDFEDQFKIGGYYANVEMDPQKVTKFLEKFKLVFTQLAAIYIEKIKQLSN